MRLALIAFSCLFMLKSAWAKSDESLFPRSNADRVFFLVKMARAELKAYDELLATYKADSIRGWQMARELNEFRGEILDKALQAYWLRGPKFMGDNSQALREYLFLDRGQAWEQYPEDLQELVTFGILDHLPESPYPNAEVTGQAYSSMTPGSIVYKPVAAEVPYSLPEAGGYEFYFLGIVDTEKNGTSPEVVEALFRGDIHGLLDIVPENLIWFKGFYPAKGTKYRELLGH